MDDNIYKIVELAGSSETNIEDAIAQAIARASQTLHDLRWFEVTEMRGKIDAGKVHYWQVVLKVGFTLNDA
jgi:dodecin